MKPGSYWLKTPVADSIFILSPPFICLLLIILFPSYFIYQNQVGLTEWVVLVLLIDVAHVYSTLFKTYWNKTSFERQKRLFISIPLISWLLAASLYSLSPTWFWHALAYLAVFHFVRQQYGFMQLYSRDEKQAPWKVRAGKVAIYTATIGPLAFWHFSSNRTFNWFLPGDFFTAENQTLALISLALFWIIEICYAIILITDLFKKRLNVPKSLFWLGTVASWFIGIVVLNGDLTFTLFNVLAHGIPYMALVFWNSNLNGTQKNQGKMVFVFLLPLIVFAFVEEGLWDGFFWREAEHRSIFSIFHFLPKLKGLDLKAIVIATLALPQITHYILDGFIWRKQTPVH